jgi:D-serine deaminase-like pyridoxal phosphate-dependent protein
MQHGGRCGPITVSTLAEARGFAAAGFRDITWAVPFPASKLDAAFDVARRVDRLALLADHPVAVAAAAERAAAAGVRLALWLEVDCGGRRSGVDPDGDALVTLARQVASSPHLELAGLLTHSGHAYACRGRGEAAAVAAAERRLMLGCAARLEAAGVAPGELSVGSTPTVLAASDLGGVAEVRPGNYAFFDAFQTAIGSCRLGEVAFSVLVTVIGHYPERGELVVDGGALALSRDPGASHVDPACGYGLVLSATGRRHAGLRVVSLPQEHGVVRAERPADLARVALGETLRIVPNHSCLAAALFDRYHVLAGGEVVDEWRPLRGW